MRALIAFDKFKDALPAHRACAITVATLRLLHPEWEFDVCPLADGGEGFCAILTDAAHGKLETFMVTGPRGSPVLAPIGFVAQEKIPAAAREILGLGATNTGTIAVIEMASASGLALLPPDQRDPWQATTFGTGELIRHAAACGVTAIILGVGGSATHDLGYGALSALGVVALDANHSAIAPPIPARWTEIEKLRGSLPADFPALRIVCDVTNPLLGALGAAAIYAPQKGLRTADLKRLDYESARLAQLLCRHSNQPDTLMDTPGAGAAGGIAFGLMSAAHAQLIPGYALVAAWLDLEARLASADLVITGEGRFDASSLSGKGPGAIAARARALGKTTHIFAGAVTAVPPEGLNLHAITPSYLPLAEALRETPALLATSVANVFSANRAAPSVSTGSAQAPR
ncbi:MAG: glycerate kinase [Opitutaceae bacterium]